MSITEHGRGWRDAMMPGIVWPANQGAEYDAGFKEGLRSRVHKCNEKITAIRIARDSPKRRHSDGSYDPVSD